MKVADLINDLEMGDRSMEHIKNPSDGHISNPYNDPWRVGFDNAFMERLVGAYQAADFQRIQQAQNQMNALQNQRMAQMFASSQPMQGLGNLEGGNLRWNRW